MVYFKDRQTFVTYRKTHESDYRFTESYGGDTSSVDVEYTSAGQEDVGAWLVWDRRLFIIASVKPAGDKSRTSLTLSEAMKVFDREILYKSSVYASLNTGAFIAKVIEDEFINQQDSFYALPMLTVNNSVTLPHIAPAEDGAVFNFYEYLVSLRESNDVFVDLTFSGDRLYANIRVLVPDVYNVSLSDGHAILKSQNFGDNDTVAKVTTIKNNVSVDWYVDASGNISTAVPIPRVNGEWKIVTVGNTEDAEQKARAAFGRTTGAHNIQFKSDREYGLGDVIDLRTNETLVRGRISARTRGWGESWWLYQSGDLAVTLTDQLKRSKV